MGQNEKKSELIKAMMNVEYYPSVQINEINLNNYMKLPFAEMMSLGTVFASLPISFRTITQTANTSVGAGLYRVVIPNDVSGILASAKDGVGTFGNVVGEKGKILARARFIETEGTPTKIATTIPYDPTMIFMAAALMNIERKLDSIQEIQQNIIDFLEQKEKSELKGDLDTLNDILSNYKYNWNNEKYKTNKHIQVQEIRRDASQKVDFYREQIEKKLSKQSLFHMNQEVNKKLSVVQSEFKNYQLALYLYSFSTFLELMLLENFESEYLKNVVQKMEEHSYQYRMQYTRCYNQIEGYAMSSVETHVLNGIASMNKVASDVVAKVPVINKSQIDETLLETSERLGKFSKKNSEQTMDQFKENQKSGVFIFIENIKTIDKLYNQPTEFLFDRQHLYIGMAER